ncbi:hypothetical protein ACSVDA_00045 [Cytobacillus sp. Hm23]
MSDCRCKGKGNNELFCRCENTPISFNGDGVGIPVPTPFVTLTTDTIMVSEKNWIAKVDSMVDILVDVVEDIPNPINLFYIVERITESTTKTLCLYNLTDDRANQQYTLTPNNTVCDEPGTGCHKYRLTVMSNNPLQQGVTLSFNCRCINVTTFQKG